MILVTVTLVPSLTHGILQVFNNCLLNEWMNEWMDGQFEILIMLLFKNLLKDTHSFPED